MVRLFILFCLLFKSQTLSADEAGEKLASKFLKIMGGAEVWQNVRTVHSHAVNHHPRARLPYIQEYWLNVRKPAHYITLKNYDMDRIRAYTAKEGWSVTEGVFSIFSEERHQRELSCPRFQNGLS